jgi:hypothetical protein
MYMWAASVVAAFILYGWHRLRREDCPLVTPQIRLTRRADTAAVMAGRRNHNEHNHAEQTLPLRTSLRAQDTNVSPLSSL